MRKRLALLSVSICILLGTFVVIYQIRSEWNQWVNGDLRIAGRDTVAFWETNKNGNSYEILRSGQDFTFYAILNGESITMDECILFYADSPQYIYLEAVDHLYYCVNKETGDTKQVESLFDQVTASQGEIRFINLMNEKSAALVRTYD